MSLRTEITVKCINECDGSCIYSCNATYSKQKNTFIQSEVDDHTKALASDALYMTFILLYNQIKNNEVTENTILKKAKESI